MNAPTRLALQIALISLTALALWALRRSRAQRSQRILAAVGAAALLAGTGYALAVYGGWTPMGRAADAVSRSPQFFFTVQGIATTVLLLLAALLRSKAPPEPASPEVTRG